MSEKQEPRFLIHQTTATYVTDPIHMQLVQMNNSVFVWVGRQQASFKDLSIAMPPLMNQKVSTATSVMGQDVSDKSRNLAQRLATKYKLQFFVSLDLGNQDDMLHVFAEKKLMEFIKSVLT